MSTKNNTNEAKNKNVKNKQNPQIKEKTNPVPVFKSPGETLWGKIVIWVLAIGFIAAIVVSVVFLILNNSK